MRRKTGLLPDEIGLEWSGSIKTHSMNKAAHREQPQAVRYKVRYDTIRYDTKRSACSEKLIDSQLNLPRGTRKRKNSDKLDGCIVLNEHNTVFASNRSAICNRCFPGPTRILNANGISMASEFSAGLTR